MCQEDSEKVSPPNISFRTSIKPDAHGVSFARDAKISIPDEGLVLKHDGEALAIIPQENVEVVLDDRGAILYISISEEDAARILSLDGKRNE
jgi:hypothetical protein